MLDLGKEGTAQLQGLGFSYKINKHVTKGYSHASRRDVTISLPYRSVIFSATSSVPLSYLQDEEQFMLLCKTLLKKILEDNEILLEFISEENS